MPTYTYKCPKCEIVVIESHGMMNDPVIKCDNCNTQMKKVPAVGAVSFKGSGWGSSGN